jgi:hypothetical protein
MPALVAGIHAVVRDRFSEVDVCLSSEAVKQLHRVGARNKCGHDGEALRR